MKEQMEVEIDEALLKRLEAEAKNQGKTPDQLVEEIMRAELQRLGYKV